MYTSAIENVAVLSGNFEYLNYIPDHSDFEAVCVKNNNNSLKHSFQGKCDFEILPRILANKIIIITKILIYILNQYNK